MFSKQLIVFLACSTFIVAGCTSVNVPYSPQTPDEAQQLALSRQVYDIRHSYAYNLARQAGIQENDRFITWKNRERLEFSMEEGGWPLRAYSALAGLAYNPWLHLTHLQTFWAPLGLMLALTLSNFDTIVKMSQKKPTLIAYVPYTGQHPDEARQEIFKNLQTAIDQVLKDKGATEVLKYDVQPTLDPDYPSEHIRYYFVSPRDCPAPFDGNGMRMQQDGQNLFTCSVSVEIGLVPENMVYIQVPYWIDPKGGASWQFTSAFIYTQGDGNHNTFDRTNFLAKVARYLPNNYFIYIPQSIYAQQLMPAVMASNKGVAYFYAEKRTAAQEARSRVGPLS